MANQGYTVIGVIVDGASHIATVRPGWNNSSSQGPMIANVGVKNGTKVLRSSITYDVDYKKGNVHFYYDSNQKIQGE